MFVCPFPIIPYRECPKFSLKSAYTVQQSCDCACVALNGPPRSAAPGHSDPQWFAPGGGARHSQILTIGPSQYSYSAARPGDTPSLLLQLKCCCGLSWCAERIGPPDECRERGAELCWVREVRRRPVERDRSAELTALPH